MGYRDEGEAALQRVQNLESQLAEKDAENRELTARLAQANAELVRLHGKPIASPVAGPVPVANGIFFRVMLLFAGVALFFFIVAATQSETAGVQMSLLALPLCGGAIGGWLQRRQPTGRFLVSALAGAFGTFVLLFIFFATIWRSL